MKKKNIKSEKGGLGKDNGRTRYKSFLRISALKFHHLKKLLHDENLE